MLGAICGLIVAVLLRILVEYLSGEFMSRCIMQ